MFSNIHNGEIHHWEFYRFWRDLGFVFGAVGIDFIAYIYGLSIAIQLVSWIALASGIFVFIFMRETKKGH